ncbi:MAG: hypothetical protein Q9167_000223 [Letrouitia subvulpina]
MSDTGKSQSPFSLGSSATSGGSGLFGGQNQSSQNQNSLFGSSSQPTATSRSNLFGGTSATTGGSLFTGQANSSGQKPGAEGGSGLFGGAGKASPTPFSFGPNINSQNSGGGNVFAQNSAEENSGGAKLFGQTSATQPQQGSSSFQPFSPSGKPSDSKDSNLSQTSNIFGNTFSSGKSAPFSNFGSNPTDVSSTPASKPSTGFPFQGSTTPAGPPPSSGTENKAPSSLSFPSLGSGSSGFSFGSSKPTDLNTTTSTSQAQGNPFQTTTNPSSNLFGNVAKTQENPPTTSSNISDQKLSSTKPSSLFSQVPTDEDAAKPSTSSSGMINFLNPQTETTAPTHANNLFENTNSKSASGALGAVSSAAPSSGLFSNLANQSASNSAPNSSRTSSNLFNTLGKESQADSQSMGAPTTSGKIGGSSSNNLFGNLGQSTTATDQSGQAQPSGPAAASSLFGDIGKNTASSANAQTGQKFIPDTSGKQKASGSATLGASTSGPLPTAQSRLKNKSMDEIITRWASDLSKYQKEFQKQAEKVASWDRMLMENSEKIQKLYGNTLEAERATAEVERQITAVENDQTELEGFLDRYETEVDRMISSQVGPGESHIGPDSERERTYHLAERLTDRLDDLGKDLNSMIDEINDASSSLNRNGKADDPLSQVVKVLNNHLIQLQQIDQGAAALQLKVASAQKDGQRLSSTNGLMTPSRNAADGFYRSFMGRR